MSKKNKIQVIEEDHELSLSYKWFDPIKAVFFTFFSLMWNGVSFAAFANVLSTTGFNVGSLMLLPFLAIGMGLAYYTGSVYVNRTRLTVSEDSIKIGAGPLPWPQGNKIIPAADLKQLYVKEKEHYNQENGTTYYSYELRAKLQDDQDEGLMVISDADPKVVKEIEQKMEGFLGLPDYKIKGEYQALEKKTIKELPRQESRRVLPADAGIHNLRLGSFADYDGTTYEVKHQTQYDWNDGNTDKLLQFADYKNTELLVFINQNKGIFIPCIEVQLSLADTRALSFDAEIPPQKIHYKDNEFYLEKHQKGKKFIQNSFESSPAQQWIYSDETEAFYLRVVANDDGTKAAFFGRKESDSIFDNMTIV